MKERIKYPTSPFTFNRKMVAASASVGRERNNIHAMIEVDISAPRHFIREYQQRTGEKLSLTAFIITCLGRAIAQHPHMNAFRRGSRIIQLEDVTISCLVERELSGERVPEPTGIRQAQRKTHREIQAEIRAAQAQADSSLGGLSGMSWVRFIPGFLLRTFIKLATQSITMQDRYGVVGVTAVGMFGKDAMWLVPLSGATVVVTVGSIVERSVLVGDRLEAHEHLCLTATFNHDIVDGAPAARFLMDFSELLKSPQLLMEENTS